MLQWNVALKRLDWKGRREKNTAVIQMLLHEPATGSNTLCVTKMSSIPF